MIYFFLFRLICRLDLLHGFWRWAQDVSHFTFFLHVCFANAYFGLCSVRTLRPTDQRSGPTRVDPIQVEEFCAATSTEESKTPEIE